MPAYQKVNESAGHFNIRDELPLHLYQVKGGTFTAAQHMVMFSAKCDHQFIGRTRNFGSVNTVFYQPRPYEKKQELALAFSLLPRLLTFVPLKEMYRCRKIVCWSSHASLVISQFPHGSSAGMIAL